MAPTWAVPGLFCVDVTTSTKYLEPFRRRRIFQIHVKYWEKLLKHLDIIPGKRC